MLCFYKDFVFNVHEIPFIVYENISDRRCNEFEGVQEIFIFYVIIICISRFL